MGDGKVFVLPVEESYRVRTGESGEDVLQAHPDAAAARPDGARARGGGSAAQARRPSAAGLVERLREVHLAMLDAVLAGDGLARVAALAAGAAGAPVAIVVPRLGAAAIAAPDRGVGEETAAALRRYVADRVKDRPAQVPEAVAAEVPISSGDEVVGAVLLLAGGSAKARRTRRSSCTSRRSRR